jgi:hypothetical protein
MMNSALFMNLKVKTQKINNASYLSTDQHGKLHYTFVVPYFPIDNERVIYIESLNSLKINMRCIRLKGERGKSNQKKKN